MATRLESADLRINARLDADHSAKLRVLKRTTGLSASEVVKQGIDLLYAEVRDASPNAFETLSKVGFIGGGSGPVDLSEGYKEELAELLESKHGDR